jgi:hypothetical protein
MVAVGTNLPAERFWSGGVRAVVASAVVVDTGNFLGILSPKSQEPGSGWTARRRLITDTSER